MIKVDKGHVEIAESVCYAFIGVGQTKQLIGFIEKMADALEVASKEVLNDKIR